MWFNYGYWGWCCTHFLLSVSMWRLSPLSMARDVALEDILLGDVENFSSEDDGPIVATLSNITATTVKKKRKKKKQSLWTYVQVAEPTTGVASKYWDADAPPERHTKRVACGQEKAERIKRGRCCRD